MTAVIAAAAQTHAVPRLVSTVQGAGTRVVLLHGLAGSARYWDPVVARLHGQVQTWAVDLLGFGRSPKPPESRYDVDAQVAAVSPLLDRPSIVVAHSTGAIIAAALACRRPEDMDGLLLTGLPLYPNPQVAAESISRLSVLARWTVEEDRRARWACAAMCRLRPLAMSLAPLVMRDLPAAVAADGARHTWPAYQRTLQRVVIGHQTARDLSQITCPVRIVQGRDDRVAPTAVVQRTLAECVRAPGREHIRFDVVAGDHHVAHRSPELLATAIAGMAGTVAAAHCH